MLDDNSQKLHLEFTEVFLSGTCSYRVTKELMNKVMYPFRLCNIYKLSKELSIKVIMNFGLRSLQAENYHAETYMLLASWASKLFSHLDLF